MIKPAGFRVLVEPEEIETTTKSGIVLCSPAEERMLQSGNMKGTIKAVGPIAFKAFGPNHSGEPWAKVGDRIFYSKYSGKTVVDPYTDKEYIVMNDEDVVAVITDDSQKGDE